MKAWLVRKPGPAEDEPLHLVELPDPACGLGDIVVRVETCGICHTDLHIIEGDLPLPLLPVVPGHQIVGRVVQCGREATLFREGDRVGIAWLNSTCGTCDYCRQGLENLCRQARFTGLHTQGGFADYIAIDQRDAYPLSSNLDSWHTAPLLCAGIVGFRTIRVAGVRPGERVGIYGFGASAHLVLQLLKHWGCECFVFSRSSQHLELARALGAVWTGQAGDRPPGPLHRALIFAPAGPLMIEALKDVAPGGVVVSGGIHMTPIPEFAYSLLWEERSLKSVANATRVDGLDFLEIASQLELKPEIERYRWETLPQAMLDLKHSRIKAAAVLEVET